MYNFVEVSGHNLYRPEVSVYNIYIRKQFQNTFAQEGGGGVEFFSRGDCEKHGGNCPRIRPLYFFFVDPILV